MQVYQACTLTFFLRLFILGLAASPPVPPNTLITPSAPNPENIPNLPLNITPASIQNRLPYEPYIYHVPNSAIKLKFQNFGHQIPLPDVLHCLLLAANDVNSHFIAPNAPVWPKAVQVRSLSVRLVLYPAQVREPISWAKWGVAIRGITEFVTRFDFVDLDFYVLDEDSGGGAVGAGLLSDK